MDVQALLGSVKPRRHSATVGPKISSKNVDSSTRVAASRRTSSLLSPASSGDSAETWQSSASRTYESTQSGETITSKSTPTTPRVLEVNGRTPQSEVLEPCNMSQAEEISYLNNLSGKYFRVFLICIRTMVLG